MADERDLELLDDYLANRMADGDRSAFERKLEADPNLRQEYALQQRLVKGIKDARAAELKAMLNNVAVPSNTGNAMGTKLALGAVATLIIAAATYWYISHEDLRQPQETPAARQETIKEVPVPIVPEAEPQPETGKEVIEKHPAEQDKNQTSAGTEHSRPSLAKKPDPLEGPPPAGKSARIYTLDVETDSENARYRFDYRLSDGKLALFGPFQQDNFEVIRDPEGNATVAFLYYSNTWYRMEESGEQIKPLEAVTDQTVIRKLDSHRPRR